MEFIAIGLAFILVVATCGCLDDTGKKTSQAAKIKNQALSALTEVESYGYAGNVTFEYTFPDESDTYKMGGTFYQSAILDLTNKKLKISVNSLSSEQNLNITIYLLNNILYFINHSLSEESWIRHNVTDPIDMWSSLNQIEASMELMNISDAEMLNDETVRGVECNVIKMSPDLLSYLESSYGENASQFEEMFNEFTVTDICWLDKETDLILKMDMDLWMEMNLMGQNIGLASREEFDFYYENLEPIDLPEAAENADWGKSISSDEISQIISPSTL